MSIYCAIPDLSTHSVGICIIWGQSSDKLNLFHLELLNNDSLTLILLAVNSYV